MKTTLAGNHLHSQSFLSSKPLSALIRICAPFHFVFDCERPTSKPLAIYLIQARAHALTAVISKSAEEQ